MIQPTPDAAHHFFVLAVLTLATVLLVAGMRTFMAARQRRDVPNADGAAVLAALRGDIGEMKTRLAAVESMLRDVG